jgi:hypothetical protein
MKRREKQMRRFIAMDYGNFEFEKSGRRISGDILNKLKNLLCGVAILFYSQN